MNWDSFWPRWATGNSSSSSWWAPRSRTNVLCFARFTDDEVDEMYREAPIKNGMFDYTEFTRWGARHFTMFFCNPWNISFSSYLFVPVQDPEARGPGEGVAGAGWGSRLVPALWGSRQLPALWGSRLLPALLGALWALVIPMFCTFLSLTNIYWSCILSHDMSIFSIVFWNPAIKSKTIKDLVCPSQVLGRVLWYRRSRNL